MKRDDLVAAGEVDWSALDAVLLDLDGVVTPTAELHMRAWAETLSPFLDGRGAAPYTSADYFRHVDGRPRYDGVAAVLASRGIDLPYGDPADSPDTETVCGLGNRKDARFGAVLARDGVGAYPGTLALMEALAGRGTRTAVVSSSANARDVLRVAGIEDRFEAVVDGVVARREGLPGKPAPDTYRYAADRLGVPPARCAVVEDAVSGVRAGAAGGFALVVGVDRGAGAAALVEHGADLVVTDLQELVEGARQVRP